MFCKLSITEKGKNYHFYIVSICCQPTLHKYSSLKALKNNFFPYTGSG